MNRPLLARGGLSLDRLASLVALADARGVSAAARGDPARQSQFSRQLKELEAFFGVALIERRQTAVRPFLSALAKALAASLTNE